jgi:DNA replication protein DnaC
METNTSVGASLREEIEVCRLCQGTGWKTVSADGGTRVTRCECTTGIRSRRLLQNANIPARYGSCSLDNYRTDSAQQSAAQARGKALRFVDQYPIDKTGLIFVGKPGAGKTHLAIGIIKELITKKGITCFFCGYRELLEKIKNSYDPSVQTTSMQILRPVFESEVVVLDDLGAVIPTGWVWDMVSLILNTRYNDNRTTIITSNFQDGPSAGADDDSSSSAARRANREQTLGDRIGERMRDRVHEMCRMISLWDVPSYRDKGPTSASR